MNSGDTQAVKIYTDGNTFYKGTGETLRPYTDNVWQCLRIEANTETQKAIIKIDGKKIGEYAFDNAADSFDNVSIGFAPAIAANMWFDDIQVFKYDEPTDYVPVPVSAVSDDYYVFMTVCDLWRNDYHRGWDAISPYPDIEPVLGYYDDGLPEVSDWETKYMVEHGVDAKHLCWYAPSSNITSPIKESNMNNSLHDGYFNSKYSEMIKFCFMWENSAINVSSFENFKNFVWPYWKEYYFTDDRYMTMDNKPIMTVWKYANFITSFGGEEGAKTAIQFMNEDIKKLGYDGMIILFQDRGNTLEESFFEGIERIGADGAYAYHWNVAGKDPDHQIYTMSTQQDFDATHIVPAISVGFNKVGWSGVRNDLITLEGHKKVLEYVKNTFLPEYANEMEDWKKKTLVISTWNEYGEGTYTMPAGVHGFGYLDNIRSVLTNAPEEHEDVVPTASQKARLGYLYPSDRSIIKPLGYETNVSIPTGVVKSWDMLNANQAGDWFNMIGINNFDNTQGVISGTSFVTDPGIITKDKLSTDLTDVTHFHIRMKSSAAGKIELFYTTRDDTVWNQQKSASATVSKAGEYIDYYFDMRGKADFKGILESLRIEPINQLCDFEISLVEILKPTESEKPISLLINQYQMPFVFDPYEENAEVYVTANPSKGFFSMLNAYHEFSRFTGRLYIATTDQEVVFNVGSNIALVDGTPVQLGYSMYLKDGLPVLPLKFILNNLGYQYTTDGKIISVSTKYQKYIDLMNNRIPYEYEFDIPGDMEGWKAGSASVSVADGFLSGTSVVKSSSTYDPTLSSPTLNINGSEYNKIVVGMKYDYLPAGSSSNSAAIYFKTQENNSFSETKTVYIPFKNNTSNGQVVEFVFDMKSNALWTGTVTGIRFDPFNKEGSFAIDYIRLIKDSSVQIVPIYGDNLIIDPYMEFGSSTQITNTSSAYEYTTTQAHSPNQSVKITKQGPYGSIYFSNLGQVKEQAYYYSAWLKLDENSVSLQNSPVQYPVARVCVQYKLDGVTKNVAMLTSCKLNSTEWQQVQGIYTINELGTVTDIRMFIFTDSPDACDTFYLDDIEIRPVTYTIAALDSLSITADKTVLQKGDTASLTLTSTMNNGTVPDMTKAQIVYTSDKRWVATVDQNGIVTAIGGGTAIIKAAVTIDGITKEAEIQVTVEGMPVEEQYETVTLTVKTDGTGDFISPKLANDSIIDSSADKRYVIEVYPGVYTETNWLVKPYTTIRGTDRDNCWLKGELPESSTNNQITNTSTIWLKDSANLENLKITSKNMRYPVHSEASGKNQNAEHNVKNCYIEHYGNLEAVQYRQSWVAANPGVTPPADLNPTQVWGGISGNGSHAWGYGSASGIVENFYDSTFVSKADGWYVHNNQDFTMLQINTINNSKIVSTVTSQPISVQSMGSGTEDQVIFNNCEFIGTFMRQSDSPWITQRPENQYANHADYTVTFNNSTPIGYMDGHRGRALAIFSNSIGSSSYVRVSGDAVADLLGLYITKYGGGTLKGYIYGYWDISGIKVGLNSNITVNNTLGRRLGDCTSTNKILNVTFEDGTTKSIVFNEDYTAQTNAYVLAIINGVLGSCGSAVEYNVTANEYYPEIIDKQMTLTNNTSIGIPRFSAVCYNSDAKSIRLMKSTDLKDLFLGITLEGIAPGQSGRILTEGIVHKAQLNGFSGSIATGTQISISSKDGCFAVNTANPVMQGISTDWAYFKGSTSLKVKVIGDNMIEDSGMEAADSTQIIGWETTREYTTQQKYNGNQSMKVTKQKNYGNIQFRTQKQVVGQEYYYSAWVKLDENTVSLTSNPPTYPVARICLQYNVNGVIKQTIILTSTALSSTEWRQIQGTYTLNEAGTVTDIRMFIYTDKPAALDTYYLDNVEIRPVTYTTYVPVAGISLNTMSTAMRLGEIQTLTADIQPANATSKGVVWSSDNTDVAAVDENGAVYAKNEGSANIKATTMDGDMTATVQIIVDGTSPVTALNVDGMLKDIWYSSSVTVTINSSDSLSGIDKTEYRFGENGDWLAYTAPVTIVQDGNYMLQYRSTDKAGNVEETKQETIKLDKTAPVTTATPNGTIRSDGTYDSHVSVALASEDVAEGSGVALIEYSLDGTNWLTYTAPLELTDNVTYSISYKTTDNAGNTETVKNINIIISMNPYVMITYLNETVNATDIDNGIKNSLVSKLGIVLSSIMSGDKYSSANQINAFINEVDAQSGKKLTASQADGMKTEANKIITRINEATVFGIPGKAVLSDDNGQDTGLKDVNYKVTMNLWWGNNATAYKLYENGVLIDTQTLTPNTPNAQTAVTSVTGSVYGKYTYYCELINDYGITVSDVLTVNVTQTKPGQPVISNDNWDGDDSYTVRMDMWWGIIGTTYKLYENGILIDMQTLADNTPNMHKL